MPPKTLYQKIWDSHLVHEEPGQPSLIYIDRHLIHEGTSPQAFAGLRAEGRKVRRPDLTFAVMDHSVSTTDRTLPILDQRRQTPIRSPRKKLPRNRRAPVRHEQQKSRHRAHHRPGTRHHAARPNHRLRRQPHFHPRRIRHARLRHRHQRSRTRARHPMPRAIALQNDAHRRQRQAPHGVTAKDLILAIIGKIGIGGGTAHVAEYGGQAIRELSMDGRMTVCNMTIEGGARAGMIAPDDTTFAYLEGRPFVPRGKEFQAAVDRWKQLTTDDGATFDTTVELARRKNRPASHLGHQPGHGHRRHRSRSRSRRVPRPQRPESHRARPRLHGPQSRHADRRHSRRSRLHRLLHQFPHRRPSRRRPPGRRQARCAQHQASSDRPRLPRHQSPSRKRRPATKFSPKQVSNGATQAAACASA